MLDGRKIRVLCAIIDSYVQTAEPIGSKKISKDYDLGVSSATIRNEMSDLEGLGYLSKTHTSSGRIPSDKAYRFYVNEILRAEKRKMDIRKKEKIKQILFKESNEIEQLIQNSASILSAITSYTALAVSPQLKTIKLKHIQLIPIDDKKILIVLVGDSGIIKNAIFRMKQGISTDQLNKISNFLNYKLKGLSIDGIAKVMKNEIFKEMYEFREIINSITPIINRSLEDIDNVEVYADGVARIFDFPEYKDTDRVKSFISFIEDKEQLINVLLNDSLSSGIEITIGDENIYEPIKNCSLITTTYRLGDITIGKIGVIGPTRMDYLMAINSLRLFSVNMTEILDMLLKR